MAGLSLPFIAGAGQGALAGQQAVQQNQMNQLDMQIRRLQLEAAQTQQAAQQATALRQQNADAAAAGVLQQYYGSKQNQQPPAPGINAPPPQPPQQQSPAPGQPSVPMMQPGQQPPPMPPGGPQGQMPPAGTPPLPPGQPGGRPAAPPPYQRIATQQANAQQQQAAPPQQPQAPQPIPAEAPAEGSLNFQTAAKMLAQKGISGPAMVDALDRLKPYLDEQAKQDAASLKAQLSIQKATMDAMKLQLSGRHEDALEANQAAMRGLQEQRLSIEASRAASEAAARGRAATDREAALDQAKIPTGYERDPKTGKLKPMEGGPYDPASPNYKAPKGATRTGTIADKMNPTMLASVKLDIQEGRNGLDTIKKLTTDTAGPYFAHDQASPLAAIMGRALTTEQQQQYEVAMNRMAVAIASVQSMGRGQISDAKVNEARKLVPQLGDKPGTRQLKLQQIQKIFDLADQTLSSKAGGNPAEPDQDREAATAGSVPGGGNAAPPKSVHWDDLK